MPMLQISLPARAEQTDAVEELLLAAGAVSVVLQDAGDVPLLEPMPGEMPLWPELIVTGLFEQDTDLPALIRHLASELGMPERHIRHQMLEDQDWVRSCMQDFQPMRFGSRLWIVPSWHEPPDPGAVNIRLDPGLAFGTGTHPTTAMCLGWLDAHAPRGARVLDYGCGSGILAIAALLLDAASAWAVDIDPQALTATAENALRNDIDGARLSLGQPGDLPSGTGFDLTLANILAAPLKSLAPALGARTRPGGYLVMAGLLDRQADELMDIYRPDFEMRIADSREGWTLLEGRRRPA